MHLLALELALGLLRGLQVFQVLPVQVCSHNLVPYDEHRLREVVLQTRVLQEEVL